MHVVKFCIGIILKAFITHRADLSFISLDVWLTWAVKTRKTPTSSLLHMHNAHTSWAVREHIQPWLQSTLYEHGATQGTLPHAEQSPHTPSSSTQTLTHVSKLLDFDMLKSIVTEKSTIGLQIWSISIVKMLSLYLWVLYGCLCTPLFTKLCVCKYGAILYAVHKK